MEKNKDVDIWEEYESKPILAEWTEAQKTKGEWLTQENIKETATMLETVETQEDFDDYRQFIPKFAIKAAITYLQESKVNQLIQFGAERVTAGLFESWRESEMLKNFSPQN